MSSKTPMSPRIVLAWYIIANAYFDGSRVLETRIGLISPTESSTISTAGEGGPTSHYLDPVAGRDERCTKRRNPIAAGFARLRQAEKQRQADVSQLGGIDCSYRKPGQKGTILPTPSRDLPGYSYGFAEVKPSHVSLADLTRLKLSTGFTERDQEALRLAGEVLADQTEAIVHQWRSGIIASIPHLAKHSRTPEGDPIPEYLAKSNLRFEQWIVDTCTKPYDQDWLNYQQEIALRHTAVKKNQTDGVHSTPYVPLSDVVAFVAVMNETIRPYLASKGHAVEDVERMHLAWCKSMQLQMALWVRPYMEASSTSSEV
jgi:Protoglobin